MDKNYAEILLTDFNLKPLIYRVPEHLAKILDIGMLVSVPLKNRVSLGFILNLLNKPADNLDNDKIF